MAVSINEANSLISSFLRSGPFSNIKFDKYGDRTYVSYISDELNGVYLRAFGGDYESSIIVAYSQGVGLTIEIYFSSSKGRLLQYKVPTIVRDGLAYYGYDNFARCDFTKFIPGESAFTICLTTHPYSASEMSTHLSKLGGFVRDLTTQL